MNDRLKKLLELMEEDKKICNLVSLIFSAALIAIITLICLIFN